MVGFKKKYNIVFRQVFFILQNTCPMIFLLPSLPSPFLLNRLIHRQYRVKTHPVLPSTVPVIRMLGAQHPYAYCLRTVCPVLKRHLYEDGRTGAGLHPLFPMNKAIKQER